MAVGDGRDAGGRPAAFSGSEAAFTGLRLLTREPRTWLVWGALYLAFSLGLGVLMVVTAGPALMQIMALQGTRPDPAASLALMGRLAPAYSLTMAASLVFYAVAFAAVNRAVLRPAPGGLAHLALGGDELRQLIVLVLLGLVLLGVYIAAVVVGVVVGVVLALAAAASHVGGSATTGGLAALLIVILVLGVLGAVLFVMTRLSLASPLALDTGRIDLGASWRMTRGRFWAVFGTYVLAWLVSVVILIGVGVVFAVVAVTTGGGLKAAGVLFRPDMSSLQTYFGPLQVAWMVVNAVMAPVLFALALGAPAGVYAQLRGSLPATAVPPTPASDLPRFGN